MLYLNNITKDYKVGDGIVHALKGINLTFKESEFVSILGPSGCGKTTMLNIVGGLDKYTSGDLLVDGKSTKEFKDGDWDAYRNNTIGIVFQSYNLIPHLTVLENVAIALTLSGESISDRNERAKKVLTEVGLEDKFNKKPNQLSGGQMQRVAIARALANDPKILLADEPTGALDSKTSVQIMELIKKISETRLVIMVTHNKELAKQYSDRIIELHDGLVVKDSSPATEVVAEEGTKKLINKRTSMNFLTALKISFKNLLTKKGRTIMTSVAGSIGIIGVGLVLAVSGGMTTYVNNMQSGALAGFPLTISQTTQIQVGGGGGNTLPSFPDSDDIFTHTPGATVPHINRITPAYIAHLNEIEHLTNAITFSYGMELNVITRTDHNTYVRINTEPAMNFGGITFGSPMFQEIPDSRAFIESQYELIGQNSIFPTESHHVALIIDRFNRVNINVLNHFGIANTGTFSPDDFLGRTLMAVHNNDFYTFDGTLYRPAEGIQINSALFNSPNNLELEVVAIMRVRESASAEVLGTGFAHTAALTRHMLQDAHTSNVAAAQRVNITHDVTTGDPFVLLPVGPNSRDAALRRVGADISPTGVSIFPINFDAKEQISAHLDYWNDNALAADRVFYTDIAEMITGIIGELINTITIVLTVFASIALVVSSVMIAIITYTSVIERTKEIGILRAIGARKKDISRLFNAETAIIGFTAGAFGVLITYLLSIPINIIVNHFVGVNNIAMLNPLVALVLIGISVGLTLIAGFIPSRYAAKKDPVTALRSSN